MIAEQVLSNEAKKAEVAVIYSTIVFYQITQQLRHITNQSVAGLARFVVHNKKYFYVMLALKLAEFNNIGNS